MASYVMSLCVWASGVIFPMLCLILNCSLIKETVYKSLYHAYTLFLVAIKILLFPVLNQYQIGVPYPFAKYLFVRQIISIQ